MLKIHNTFWGICAFAAPFLAVQNAFADTDKGEAVYVAHCAICHGEKGVSFTSEVPSFTQKELIMKSDAILLETLSNGRNAMPAYFGILGDQDMIDVIAFLRTLN